MASMAQPKALHLEEGNAPARKNASLEGIGLTKRYGGRAVVNNVRVRVGNGEVVGLLGPNGAGKTTTFYMLVGLLRPDLIRGINLPRASAFNVAPSRTACPRIMTRIGAPTTSLPS